MRGRRTATAVGAGLALTAGAVMSVAHASANAAHGTASGHRAAPVLARYYDQSITWHKCQTGPDDKLGKGLDAIGAQCGQVTVPLTYSRPDGRTITVAFSRIKATDPARRRGVLLINPGGPGVPGMEQVALGQLIPDVAARYDLIGMDPRFVGRSTPLNCRWRTDTFLRSAGPTRRSFDRDAALQKALAAGCVTGNQDVLRYASTRNTARDMDVIRAALGADKLSYLGASYGTYLGAVYLQMFGERADRVVLDGAVDPHVYGPGLLSRDGPAAAAALRHWASWAAGHNSNYGLGSTTGSVLSTVARISEVAVRSPLRVGKYRVGTHVLPYFLFISLYDDSGQAYAEFAESVRVLSEAAHGARATPTPSLEQFLAGVFTGAGTATDRAGTPILCADRAVSHDPGTYFRDIQAHRADEPLFGPLLRNITPCAFWPTRPAERPTTISNDVPALMVGADGDPVAPYAGQLAMHRALAGSRLVTLRGSFHHTVYLVAGSTCIDTAVSRYLISGILPARDAACTAASPAPGRH
jgi:pimeloyl-ACP methyl ester carboxylesterase